MRPALGKPDCPRCKTPALVRKETIVKARVTIESFYCGRCDLTWDNSGDPRMAAQPDLERPDRSRAARTRPPVS